MKTILSAMIVAFVLLVMAAGAGAMGNAPRTIALAFIATLAFVAAIGAVYAMLFVKREMEA